MVSVLDTGTWIMECRSQNNNVISSTLVLTRDSRKTGVGAWPSKKKIVPSKERTLSISSQDCRTCAYNWSRRAKGLVLCWEASSDLQISKTTLSCAAGSLRSSSTNLDHRRSKDKLPRWLFDEERNHVFWGPWKWEGQHRGKTGMPAMMNIWKTTSKKCCYIPIGIIRVVKNKMIGYFIKLIFKNLANGGLWSTGNKKV